MYDSDGLRAYRRARTTFSAKVYGILILWFFLAIVQWISVCLIEDARTIFKKYYYISLIAFALAVLLLTIFIFADGLRFMQFLNFIISLFIVELQIVATFILVALSWWADLLVFFVVTVALISLFLLIGIALPRKMDLTLDIAVLFIIAFIFLIIAVFALTLLKNLWFTEMYVYLTLEVAVTLTILMFVIYHAQTIHGNRFAEMRLNDFFLGSLILFHDFLIIFWLTFYWQIRFRPVTPNSWVASSMSPNKALELDDSPKDWDAFSPENVFTEQTWADGRGIEDQDEDSSREVTKRRVIINRISASHGNDRINYNHHGSKTTPIDWSVFKAKTIASLDNQDEPAQKIEKSARSEYRSPGVLYKVKPVYGSVFPAEEDEPKDKNNYVLPNEIVGSAKGKSKAGDPSLDFSVADNQTMLDLSREFDDYPEGSDEFKEYPDPDHVPEEKLHHENTTTTEKPNLLGDEVQGSNETTGSQTVWEFLGQEELKNLSDSKELRGWENNTASPGVEPQTVPALY